MRAAAVQDPKGSPARKGQLGRRGIQGGPSAQGQAGAQGPQGAPGGEKGDIKEIRDLQVFGRCKLMSGKL